MTSCTTNTETFDPPRRCAAALCEKSTPGSFAGFFNRDKTPSTHFKSGRSSGLGFESGSKVAGSFIPEEPEDAFPIPENYDDILGEELDFSKPGSSRRRHMTTPTQPSLLETEEDELYPELRRVISERRQ